MHHILKHKQYYKALLLVIVFSLLLLSIGKDLSEIYAVSSSQQNICVPIMVYHQVKNSKFGKDVISPYEFESDLKYLSENKYTTITMTQLIDYVYKDGELPENPIILSFDDGYLSTYKYVYPLLVKYNMKIVLSIVGKSTDAYSKVHDVNIDYASMTWDQLNEIQNSGLVEIQNHTYNLHKVKNGRYGCYQKDSETLSQYEQILTEDLLTLQEKIYSVTDSYPNTFTYPYGKYNDTTETIVKNIGFQATLSCTYGVNLINKEKPETLFGLKRICRAHNQNMNKLLVEAMKTLKYRND